MPYSKKCKPLADVPITIIKERLPVILKRVRGKSVLDVGCTDSWQRSTHPHYQSFHALLAREAREILGVDIDKDGITAMKASGFNVQAADAETMNLGRRFEMIVAGEVIEHLANPGLFLTNMHHHLEDAGELIITTPNPFSFKQGWRILRHNSIKVHPEHTLWVCPTVLKRLLGICGFEMTHLFWIRGPRWYLPRQWLAILRPYWSAYFIAMAHKKGGH